jgi:hypothetical protein
MKYYLFLEERQAVAHYSKELATRKLLSRHGLDFTLDDLPICSLSYLQKCFPDFELVEGVLKEARIPERRHKITARTPLEIKVDKLRKLF